MGMLTNQTLLSEQSFSLWEVLVILSHFLYAWKCLYHGEISLLGGINFASWRVAELLNQVECLDCCPDGLCSLKRKSNAIDSDVSDCCRCFDSNVLLFGRDFRYKVCCFQCDTRYFLRLYLRFEFRLLCLLFLYFHYFHHFLWQFCCIISLDLRVCPADNFLFWRCYRCREFSHLSHMSKVITSSDRTGASWDLNLGDKRIFILDVGWSP